MTNLVDHLRGTAAAQVYVVNGPLGCRWFPAGARRLLPAGREDTRHPHIKRAHSRRLTDTAGHDVRAERALAGLD